MSSTPNLFSERELLASLIDTETDALLCIDTGQHCLALDTGQRDTSEDALALSCPLALSSLVIRKHEIHRRDEVADGETELVTSTLKFFHIEVALVDLEGGPILQADGRRVHAMLIYEDGEVVEELSASLEPPLLGGDSQLEGGCATFRLRITVLSSLCNARKFRIHIALESHPEVSVASQAVKTITKLRRGSRGASAGAAKEAVAETDTTTGSRSKADLLLRASSPVSLLSTATSTSVKRALSASAPQAPVAKGAKEIALQGAVDDKSKTSSTSAVAGLRSLSSLWDEVRANSLTLRKLQEQQRELFDELRRLSARGDHAASLKPAAASSQQAIRT